MKRHTLLILNVISIIPLALLVYGYFHQDDMLASQQTVRSLIEPYGRLAPFAFVVLQAVQVVVTPISHYTVGLAGGFLFGAYWGSLLNWIGRVIGHIAAFAIARHLARPLVSKMVSPESLARYDKYVSGNAFALFIAFFLPFFPDDELSYVAGVSKMGWGAFLVANLLGQIGGSIGLAFPGAGRTPTDPVVVGLSVITLLVAIGYFGFRYWYARRSHLGE